MDEFARDNDWQAAMRDRFLVPFYEKKWRGRYRLLDGREMQGRIGADTAIFTAGGVIRIEEKIVRWPGYEYLDFCLETMSCTVPGREKEGWMRTSNADWLLYCFSQKDDRGLLCYLMDFPTLKVIFTENEECFKVFGPLDTLNRSSGRKVPIRIIAKAMKVYKFSLP